MNDQSPRFIYICTQHGAENACKRGILQSWPQLRFAFSRPGFLTFKLEGDFELATAYDLKNVFVRCTGFSSERIEFLREANDSAADFELADETVFSDNIARLLKEHPGKHVHVWSRDQFPPGTSLRPALQQALGSTTYFPGTSEHLSRLVTLIKNVCESITDKPVLINQEAANNQRVLDLILVDPGHVWTGWHVVHNVASRWPGGIPAVSIPEDMVSRAYLKMNESLIWSRLPLLSGDQCAEIGAAPGGACQALLERGAQVIGIDPAEVDKRVADNPNFRFLRGRGAEIRCRELRDVKWLFADTNVAPTHTLDTVERIVTNDAVHVRGMILTLKLSSFELADEIPAYLQRVKSWGFKHVRARQLAHNRSEFCLAAFRNKAMLRFAKKADESESPVKFSG